jgi:hypothetical protein
MKKVAEVNKRAHINDPIVIIALFGLEGVKDFLYH